MNYTYAVETYRKARKDADLLLRKHAEEVADAPAWPDDSQYDWMCRAGMLHIVTVRADGELVGYHCSIVRTHLHHVVLTAFSEAFFLAPEHRKGTVGIKLFEYAEETLLRRGVRWIYAASTTKHDIGKLLERKGFRHVEDIYLKEMT